MKRFLRNTVSTGLALALLTAPLAMAQQAPYHQDQTHSSPAHGPATPQHGTMAMQHNAPVHPGAPMAHNMESGSYGHMAAPPPGGHMAAPPPGGHMSGPPSHQAYNGGGWHTGGHYTGSRHVVNDWSHYHLRQPPHGYEWVQDGDQFVLIAVTSGIIASIIAGSMQ